MTINSEKIAELLHLARAPGWTTDNTLELSAAVKAATEDEQRAGLLGFVMGLLNAARQIATLQLDTAIIEEVIAERDERGPLQ